MVSLSVQRVWLRRALLLPVLGVPPTMACSPGVPASTTSVPVTTALPFGATQIPVRSLAVAPAGIDGVYIVAGSIDGTGGIARCKKSGECAH